MYYKTLITSLICFAISAPALAQGPRRETTPDLYPPSVINEPPGFLDQPPPDPAETTKEIVEEKIEKSPFKPQSFEDRGIPGGEGRGVIYEEKF